MSGKIQGIDQKSGNCQGKQIFCSQGKLFTGIVNLMCLGQNHSLLA